MNGNTMILSPWPSPAQTIATVVDLAAVAEPWKRQNDEPARLYARFDAFLRLGPSRCLQSLYNEDRRERGLRPANKIADSWRRAAVKWQWKERAEAYDGAEITRYQERYRQRRERVEEAAGRLAGLMNEAADTLQALLASKSDSIRLGAAKAVFDMSQRLMEMGELERQLIEIRKLAEDVMNGNLRNIPRTVTNTGGLIPAGSATSPDPGGNPS
jgi:hypothetical protein